MLSVVGESAQVALQAGTMAEKEKRTEKLPENPARKRKSDTVTLSPEAVQLTHAAVSATEKSHHEPQQEKSREESTEERRELAQA